ncbi:restriction endonuclease subunit S [Marinobacter sp. bablab_jr015]|uniref:restriction endonuclease subunit S n=2 Tax=unclassified Marinobacter TaxID=83889 RepID=UPI0018F166B8|nr:restriction endonuclease subunit S [Marinobacter sp. bablab_jr015]
MVPEGWKISTLGEVCGNNLQTGPFGSQLHANEYEADGVPVLMPKDLNGFRADTSSAAKISVERARDLSKHRLCKGDILFSRRGDVTRFALIDEASAGSLCGTGCLKATPGEQHSPEFLSYFLQKHWVRKWLEQNAVGQTMPNMNTAILSELPLMVAGSRQEEDTIAQILSTWDQAITATERLLENSQQRKKGLMQQLLTGKKRLPGFEGEWKKVELGEALAYQQPTPFLVTSTEYSDDFPTPVLTAGKSFLLGYTDETFGIYDDGLPVIIFDDFTTASQYVDFPFKAKSSAMKILTAKPGYSIRFIFEAMRMIRFAVGGHQRHWISIFANLVIPCPSSEEQHAISEVCATADREISSLQARLDSLKSEKKALMQQLLTGKRRVQVDTEAA